jgi:hypothetical protein
MTVAVVLAIALRQQATAQTARDIEPIVLTGAEIPDWSRLPATTVCAAYPSGTTGGRDAHNGTTIVPPDIRTGVPVGEIVAYRWTGLSFEEIPVQVDQRFNYCLSNPPSGFSFYSGTDKELTYAWDSENWKKTDGECSAAYPPDVEATDDPVATLDDDDEIVFMSGDAGLQAPLAVLGPFGTSEGHSVAIVDPLNPADLRFVYLYRKPGGSSFTAGTGYVSYQRDTDADEWIDRYSIAADDPETLGVSNTDYGPNLAGTVCRTAVYPGYPMVADGAPRVSSDRFVRDGVTVSTDAYQWRATGRWMVRDLRIAKPGQAGVYGPDLLDRWKGRAFQQSPDSTISLVGFEDEQVNWEANSALLGERTGPVRAIREVWGADSGTNVTKTETFYRDAITYRYHVRVHPIPPDGLYTSWDYNAGVVSTYYNTLKSGGVAIDGQNDDVGSVDGVFGVPAFFDVPDPTFNVPSAILNWEQISGASDFGSLVYILELKGATTLVNPAVVPYYRDDGCLDDGTGDDPVPRPWPGEASTDPRVIDGYVEANGGTPYEQLACAQRQGAWGAHGIHYFVTGDSDNAASPEVLTEIDAQQWQFAVPQAAPANVGQAYANTVVAPLIAAVLPLDPSAGLLPPSAGSSAVATEFEVAVETVLSGSDVNDCDLTFTILEAPAHGDLGSITNAACSLGLPSSDHATVTYVPDSGYSGTDAFVFQITDGLNQSASGSISVTVKPKLPPTCATGPLPGCEGPGQADRSTLRITDGSTESRDRLSWRWQGGNGEFGNPASDTDYELCVFDAQGVTIAHATVPAGGDCDGRPCWRQRSSGFRYSQGKGASSMRLTLRTRGADTRIMLSGRGARLVVDPLPAAQPLTVQLQNSDGRCWEADYSAPARRNEDGQFRDQADP